MQKPLGRNAWWGMCISLVVTVGAVAHVAATPSSSSNYQVIDTQFGAGGTLQESCSGQYCAQVSIGDPMEDGVVVPGTAAFSSDAESDEPLLDVVITSGVSNLGVLSTQSTATKTMSLGIKHHRTGGYTLQIVGEAPSFEGYTLATSAQPVQSLPGTEQFGLNLVTNTTPVVGSDPVQNPADSEVLFGAPTDPYGIENLFLYKNEDVVARSSTQSGETTYTVSMIVNISSSTPPGIYASDFTAVVMPAF